MEVNVKNVSGGFKIILILLKYINKTIIMLLINSIINKYLIHKI